MRAVGMPGQNTRLLPTSCPFSYLCVAFEHSSIWCCLAIGDHAIGVVGAICAIGVLGLGYYAEPGPIRDAL